MAFCQAQVPGLEVAEGVQLVSLGSEHVQPVLKDGSLVDLLGLEFGWLVSEPGDGVRKLVLEELLFPGNHFVSSGLTL